MVRAKPRKAEIELAQLHLLADSFKSQLKVCRNEGLSYEEMARVVDVPGYCLMAINGEIKANREQPRR